MATEHEVRWMFHSTAMVADYVAARDWLIDFCGLRVLHDTEDRRPGIERRGGMVWIGDNSIEIGQPLTPGAASARFVERFGPGMHSVALQVRDIEATIAYLAERGVRAASRPGPDFIFSDPRATEGLLFEWYGGQQKDDPRWGVPLPPFVRTPRLDVQRMAFVGAIVPEPRATAERLAELFRLPVTFEDAGAGPERPQAGVSVGDCTLALYRLSDPETSAALWGRQYRRAQVHLQGLLVPELATAAETLARAGVALVRRDATTLVPRPDQTGAIQLAFTDRLLPGDPREGVGG